MSFLKAFWKNQGKHKKLGDEWAFAKDQEGESEYLPQSDNNLENKTFKVKYLGRTPLILPTNHLSSTKAINTILAVAKTSRKKPQRVEVTLTMKGIEVVDTNAKKTVLDISIFSISNCSADSLHSRVFAFLATNSYETTECHAFLCSKRGIAEQMAITVAKSFNAVYEAWLEKQNFPSNFRMENTTTTGTAKTTTAKSNTSQNDLNVNNKHENDQNLKTNNYMLIDMSANKCKENSWVSFENDYEDSTKRAYQSFNLPSNASIQTNSISDSFFNSNADWKDRNSIDLLDLFAL